MNHHNGDNIYFMLDILFMVLHTCLILFNLFGWIHPKTRKINFLLLALTGLSWTVLGLFYGFGYCPLTDWHFEILERKGDSLHAESYINYLIFRIFNFNLRDGPVDIATALFYMCALGCSVYVNFFGIQKGRKTS